MKLYLNLHSDFYIAFNGNKVFVLDIKKDQFISIDNQFNNFIYKYFVEKQNYISDNNNYYESKNLNILINKGIICSKFFPYPEKKFVDSKKSYNSINNIDWNIPSDEIMENFSFSGFQKEWLTIFNIVFTLKVKGFSAIIQKIKNQNQKAKNIIHDTNKLKIIAKNITQASFYFPKQIKCLEWAASVVLFALKNGVYAKLIIGIQTYPFISHAWVEDINKKVIFDDPKIANSLSRILIEPT